MGEFDWPKVGEFEVAIGDLGMVCKTCGADRQM